MKKGKILFCLLIAVLMIMAAACGGPSADESNGTESSGEKITLKIAHVVDPSHHYQIGAENFKKLVEERTEGRVEVTIFPSSQLGNERAILEGMKMGSIEMGIITSGALSGFVPEFAVLDLGYLFKDLDEAMDVLNGPIGDEFSQKMIDDAGIRNLGYLRYGFRSVYADKPINSPDDLKGMKIRTMENPAHMDIFKALGANPTPMGYGELYTGLQQNVVDGAENLPDLYYNSKHYEVAKEYSMTNHVYCIVMWMMSDKVYQSLPEDLRPIVLEAAAESIDYENGLIVEQMSQARANLEAGGVTITEPDITPFQEAVKKSWHETAKSIPNGEDYLQRIMEATGQK